MSEAFLGPLPFDIHGGGLHLIFPHPANEIAQSCCAHGIDAMARYGMHNGFLDMRGEKMSKSLGNVIRIPEALEAAAGEAVRLHLLSTHYRQPADFTVDALHEAKRTLDRFYGALMRVPAADAPAEPAVIDALADDLNTANAMAALHDLVGDLNRSGNGTIAGRVVASGSLLGLFQADPKTWLHGHGSTKAGIKTKEIVRFDVRPDGTRGDKYFVEENIEE